MYDVIYLADERDYSMAQRELKSNFLNPKIKDASDEFHPYRLSIELEINNREYFLKLLDLGLALCSLKFNIYAMDTPKKCKQLIQEWETSQHKTEQVITDLREQEEDLRDE